MKYTSKFSGEEIDSILDSVASKQDAIPDLETIRSNAKNASDTIARMVESGYLFAGVATINTNPGTPNAKVFYIANGKGTYTNFGGLEVTEDEVVVLYWDTAWHKVATGIASQAKLSELDAQINGVSKTAEKTITSSAPYGVFAFDINAGEQLNVRFESPYDLNNTFLYSVESFDVTIEDFGQIYANRDYTFNVTKNAQKLQISGGSNEGTLKVSVNKGSIIDEKILIAKTELEEKIANNPVEKEVLELYKKLSTKVIEEKTLENVTLSNYDNAWHLISYQSGAKYRVYKLEVGESYRLSSDLGDDLPIRYGMSDSYFYGNAISMDAYFSATEKEHIFKAEKQYLYCRHEEGLLMTKLVSKQDYIKMSRYGIRIAASDAPKEQIAVADYVCDGINDEVEIQSAIELLQSLGGGEIHLSRGNFNIEGYTVDSNSVKRCIVLSGSSVPISIIGEHMNLTNINFGKKAYELLGSEDKVEIISALPFDSAYPHTKLYMKDFAINLPNNQKNIICINLENVGQPSCERIRLMAFSANYTTHLNPPLYPASGCIGLRMTNGWSIGVINDYKNVIAQGFSRAFQVGGEHVIMINCSAIFNVYGYTFGEYEWINNFSHPITLINCCDERGINLPRFFKSGRFEPETGIHHKGIQNIDLIDFNLEHGGNNVPGGMEGHSVEDNAICEDDEQFGGNITYTMLGGERNVATSSFFQHGGKNFKVRNIAFPLSGSSEMRLSMAGDNWQEFYDTTINKFLRYIDGAWRDNEGNNVDL